MTTSEVSYSSSVGVSVWWDVESCPVPKGVDLLQVSQAIKAAVRANGMNGPVQISAVGRVSHLEKALSSAGITNIIHLSKKEGKYMIGELYCWLNKIPEPAHLFLITDRHLVGTLSYFRWRDYNVLLASNQTPAPGVLCSAVSIFWRWDDLVRNGGENKSMIGKYYNQPPIASWYGHYNVPLEEKPLFVADAADKEKQQQQVQQAGNNNNNNNSAFLSSLIAVSQEEESSRRLPVSVFWDFHSCPVPEGVNLFIVSEVIRAAVRANHMKGPIWMTALVDHSQISDSGSTHQALNSTGWTTTFFRGDMVYRNLKNLASMDTPPLHLFLITNRNFDAKLLHKFRMNHYNILLASSNVPPGVETYASIVWDWNDLVQGRS